MGRGFLSQRPSFLVCKMQIITIPLRQASRKTFKCSKHCLAFNTIQSPQLLPPVIFFLIKALLRSNSYHITYPLKVSNSVTFHISHRAVQTTPPSILELFCQPLKKPPFAQINHSSPHPSPLILISSPRRPLICLCVHGFVCSGHFV